MRKNKFKNWIIKKLGGYTSSEYNTLLYPIKLPDFTVQNIRLETINAVHLIDEFDMFYLKYPSNEAIENIKEQLKRQIVSYIEPEFVVEEYAGNKKIRAKIEIPVKYIRGGNL